MAAYAAVTYCFETMIRAKQMGHSRASDWSDPELSQTVWMKEHYPYSENPSADWRLRDDLNASVVTINTTRKNLQRARVNADQAQSPEDK